MYVCVCDRVCFLESSSYLVVVLNAKRSGSFVYLRVQERKAVSLQLCTLPGSGTPTDSSERSDHVSERGGSASSSGNTMSPASDVADEVEVQLLNAVVNAMSYWFWLNSFRKTR